MVFQEPTKIALQFRVYDQTKLFLAWNAMKPSQSYDKKKIHSLRKTHYSSLESNITMKTVLALLFEFSTF